MTGPSAGGTPLRIYGRGFEGATSVTFGGVSSPNFSVIDGTLITAVAPAGSANRLVDVVVSDAQGTTHPAAGFYYTDATIRLTPSTGLTAGDTITVEVSGYEPNVSVALAEANPLVGVAQPRPDVLPPPYVDPLLGPDGSGPRFRVDSDGALSQQVVLTSPFNQDGQQFDSQAVCPPTQHTADFGLATCGQAMSQFGVGTISAPLRFASDPTPAPPTLVVSSDLPAGATLKAGDTVKVSGTRWNAAPQFGSSTSPQKPGESQLTIAICGLGANPNACSPTTGTGSVAMTRYVDKVLSGATLEGSIVLGEDVQGCNGCVIRVRQQRFDPDTHTPANTFIEATAPLAEAVGATPTSTTTTTVAGGTTTTTTTTTTVAGGATTTTTTVDDVFDDPSTTTTTVAGGTAGGGTTTTTAADVFGGSGGSGSIPTPNRIDTGLGGAAAFLTRSGWPLLAAALLTLVAISGARRRSARGSSCRASAAAPQAHESAP